MADYKALDAKAIKLGKRIIEMCTVAGSGHPSSGLSLLHLTMALMYRTMRYDPKDPWNTGSDRLVLSEGHAVPVHVGEVHRAAGRVPRGRAQESRLGRSQAGRGDGGQ